MALVVSGMPVHDNRATEYSGSAVGAAGCNSNLGVNAHNTAREALGFSGSQFMHRVNLSRGYTHGTK